MKRVTRQSHSEIERLTYNAKTYSQATREEFKVYNTVKPNLIVVELRQGDFCMAVDTLL